MEEKISQKHSKCLGFINNGQVCKYLFVSIHDLTLIIFHLSLHLILILLAFFEMHFRLINTNDGLVEKPISLLDVLGQDLLGRMLSHGAISWKVT